MKSQQQTTVQVLKQKNRNQLNFVEKINKHDPFRSSSYSRNFLTIQSNNENEDFHLDQKSLYSPTNNHCKSNKSNLASERSDKTNAITSTLVTQESQLNCQHSSIILNKQNHKCSQKILNSKLDRKNMDNLITQEPYIKKLQQYLPLGTVCFSNLKRERSLLSTGVNLFIKNQQMLKFIKIQGCFTQTYEIMSQNKLQNIVGYLKSDLTGSIFNIYQNRQSNKLRLVGTIFYQNQFRFNSKPRKIQMYILKEFQKIYEQIDDNKADFSINLKKVYESGNIKQIFKMQNQVAVLTEQKKFVLDFEGKDVIPSINNVILHQVQTKQPLILFYKVKQNQFQLKVKQNISVFIGYCFALSSLLFKLVCQ